MAGPRTLRSVGDLLGRGTPRLSQIGDQLSHQVFWQTWLSAHLSAELALRISGVTQREGILTVFAEAAAWAARLRYALRELEGAIRAEERGIHAISVRVLPRK